MSPQNSTTVVNPREQRGLRIAERHRLRPKGDVWIVPSESNGGPYRVDPSAGRCTCPDSEVRRVKCKHLWAVYPEELWGIEDPRIAWLPDVGAYAVTYTAYSRNGPLVALALTEDFATFERRGPIMPPEDKDAAFFPRKFGDRWALIHRPVPHIPGAKANMWLSFTPDLKHYGDHHVLLEARSGAYWDAGKIGLSPPPIETPEGWLIVYHGVRQTPAGAIYRGGLALLDLDDPCRVISRGDEWVFGPEEPYELMGDVPNVVFPCGFVRDESGDTVRIYYGAADTCIAVATATVSDLLDWLRAEPNPLTAARPAA